MWHKCVLKTYLSFKYSLKYGNWNALTMSVVITRFRPLTDVWLNAGHKITSHNWEASPWPHEQLSGGSRQTGRQRRLPTSRLRSGWLWTRQEDRNHWDGDRTHPSSTGWASRFLHSLLLSIFRASTILRLRYTLTILCVVFCAIKRVQYSCEADNESNFPFV